MLWVVLIVVLVMAGCGPSSASTGRATITPPPQSSASAEIGQYKAIIGMTPDQVSARYGEATRTRTGENARESWDIDRPQGPLTVVFQSGRAWEVMFSVPGNPAPDDALRTLGFSTGKKPTTEAAGVLRWDSLDGYYVQLARDPQTKKVHDAVLRKA